MNNLQILTGDCRSILKTLPEKSVQCCVTSPPYWGLRDYGHADQIGLESTPQAYVETMRQVFKEVWRVLKDDGTLWLNLGDSYSGSGKGGNPDEGKQATNRGSQTIGVLYGKTGETARQAAVTNVSRRLCSEQGMNPKNLIGIPWRVAFALQEDGWYLRSDIIWAKPNPMPESVTDRPTKSHEYIFLLTKNDRYFYDLQSISEPVVYIDDVGRERNGRNMNGVTGTHRTSSGGSIFRNKRSVWTVPTGSYSDSHFATFPPDLIKPCILAGTKPGDTVLDPFGGSGTTGMVALELGRKAILIELNPAYSKLCEQRCNITPGLPLG